LQIPPEVIAVLRTAAPTLLSALLGPLGGLAATIATAGLDAWLGPPPKQPIPGAAPDAPKAAPPPMTPDAVVQTVRRNLDDPDFVLALKRVELDLRQYERNAQLDFAKLEQANVDSARKMATESGIAPTQFRWGMGLLILAIVMFVAEVGGVLTLAAADIEIDPNRASLLVAAFTFLGTVTGYVAGWAGSVVNFYWGRSADSDAKATELAKVTTHLGTAVTEVAARAAVPALPAPGAVSADVVAPPGTVTTIETPDDGASVPEAPPAPHPSRFVGLVDRILGFEGGYVNNPKDPGNCTNFGITLATLGDWRGAPVTCDDVKALTRQEAKEILFARYWAALSCDSLPPGLDLAVFDFGINAGVRRSALTLQTVLARFDPTLKVDGVVGPFTLAAAAKAPVGQVVDMFHMERMAFYKSLSTWATFGNGWTKRAEAVLADARAAASAAMA